MKIDNLIGLICIAILLIFIFYKMPKLILAFKKGWKKANERRGKSPVQTMKDSYKKAYEKVSGESEKSNEN